MIILYTIISVITFLAISYWLFMSPSSQIFGRYQWHAITTEKVVALTFDDGPNEPYTSEILDILKQHAIKATFFQVGACVERYPGVTKRVLADGHVIGNHSVNHQFRRYFNSLSFSKEITGNQAILKKNISKTPALFRSPWLWHQPLLFKTLRANGLTPISGKFCHPLEPFQIDGQKIAKYALKRVKPGSIIIFHDGFDARGGNRSQTVKAVKIVVDQLIKDGYSFATIDNLLAIPPYQ